MFHVYHRIYHVKELHSHGFEYLRLIVPSLKIKDLNI